MWVDHDIGAMGWWLFAVCMFIFWVAAAVTVLFVARWPERSRRRNAEDILTERYARGEIDHDEFERRRDLIRSPRADRRVGPRTG